MVTNFDALNHPGAEIFVTFPVPEMPLIRQGDDIGAIVAAKMQPVGGINSGDILLVASKAVSWAEEEDCRINLSSIVPSQEAIDISRRINGKKSPELVQLIIDETVPGTLEVNEAVPVVIGVNRASGCRITSAGVDKIGSDDTEAMILPRNPDASARRIMEAIRRATLAEVGVILTDSEGRADRQGAGAIAIACSGIDPLRITTDENGKQSVETLVDFFAGSAATLMGQRDKGQPAVIIRGHQFVFNENANLKSALHNYQNEN